MKKKILITTGGSGGHTMPATIIFDHLKKNFDVFLETDKRGSHFIDSAKYKYRVFSSVKLGSFFKIPITIYKFILILINSFFYLKKIILMLSLVQVGICLYPPASQQDL